MSCDSYDYHDDVRLALLAHGLIPTSATPPQLLRDAVNDLYRYELRRLRERYRRREIPAGGYRDEVIALRRRYPLLSIPVTFWTR